MKLCAKFSEKGEKSFEYRENADCGDVKKHFFVWHGTCVLYKQKRGFVMDVKDKMLSIIKTEN
ncbi:MAG: hypothetical protein H6Q69_4257, partial [Firmicutes bacterium]|nr:hypothetical protein [Bacillota bacterium]